MTAEVRPVLPVTRTGIFELLVVPPGDFPPKDLMCADALARMLVASGMTFQSAVRVRDEVHSWGSFCDGTWHIDVCRLPLRNRNPPAEIPAIYRLGYCDCE